MLVLTLGAFLLSSSVWAGPPKPPRRPAPENPTEERGRKRFMPTFKPFLIAGESQFARMVEAALAPDAELEQELAAWPRYKELDEAGKREMRHGFERFRRRIREEAMEEAASRGWTISPEQEPAYLRAYWTRRIQIERQLRKRAEEEWKASMEQAMADVGREFGSSK